MKVALFIPCYIDQFYPHVGIATLQLLEKLGCDVAFPSQQTCCGQPMANSGFASLGKGCDKNFVTISPAMNDDNLEKKTKFSGSVAIRKKLADGNDATYYIFSMKGKDNFIEMDLEKPATINVLLLQENIRVGQRVEKFVLEYFENSEWKKAVEGTTIGYKRLLEFHAITAKKWRLIIEAARLEPALAEIGLYFDLNLK